MARRWSHRRRGGGPPYSTQPEYVTAQQALLGRVRAHPIPVPSPCASLTRSIRSFRSSFAEKRVLFVTNNATKSRRNYKKKFDGLGIEAHVVRISPQFDVPPLLLANIPICALHWQDEVFGSAYAAAVYLSSVLKFPTDKRVYVIGMSGLEDELRSEGISFIGGTVSVTFLSVIFPTRTSFAVIAGSCR